MTHVTIYLLDVLLDVPTKAEISQLLMSTAVFSFVFLKQCCVLPTKPIAMQRAGCPRCFQPFVHEIQWNKTTGTPIRKLL